VSADFDHHAATYRDDVDRAIAFARKPVDYYARRKAEILVELVGEEASASILDVGCGVGLVDAHLVGRFRRVAGVDLSNAELEVARAANPGVFYERSSETRIPHPDGEFDVTFAACVLHHVPRAARADVVGEMARVTRPGGLVVIFEHNPLNPLTRLVVRRVTFDAGVSLLRAREVVRLYGRSPILSKPTVRNITFFPWDSSVARAIERKLAPIPLGAQYVVAARRTTS
jgi:SAM-dependent methyltransferase